MVRGDHAALRFRPYRLPLDPVAPLEPADPPELDAPLEAEPLPDCWRPLRLPEPLALPEPLRPLPERALLSLLPLLPLLALRPWLSPHADRASAIAAATMLIESLFMMRSFQG